MVAPREGIALIISFTRPRFSIDIVIRIGCVLQIIEIKYAQCQRMEFC